MYPAVLALVNTVSRGSWHGAEDAEAPEQNVAEEASQGNAAQACPHWEVRSLALEGDMHLAANLGTALGQKLSEVYGKRHQPQKQPRRGKLFSWSADQSSCMRSCIVHTSEKPFACWEIRKTFPATLGKPPKASTCVEAFRSSQRNYKCSDCGKAFCHKY